jgi:hypothetical protein
MSTSGCSQCFVGLPCARHPRGDGGKFANELNAKVGDRKLALKKLYDSVVKPQVEKLEAAQSLAAGATRKEQERYREKQGRERAKAERRGNKLTPEQQARAKELKLGGHLLGMMIDSDSDSGDYSGGGGARRRGKKRTRPVDGDLAAATSEDSDGGGLSSRKKDKKRRKDRKDRSSSKKKRKSKKDKKKDKDRKKLKKRRRDRKVDRNTSSSSSSSEDTEDEMSPVHSSHSQDNGAANSPIPAAEGSVPA